MKRWMFGFLLGMSLSGAPSAWAESNIFKMNLSDLRQVEVTSVAKKPQQLHESAAAITVISSDEIRRSGATNLPEALRLAPGVNVAQIDANKWAISVRGFNGRFANKLLVLVDGRPIYSPLYGGVFWTEQVPPLSLIDHIEVIRGPGAAVWGSNAVNGVIQIITRHARQLQGAHLQQTVGTEHSSVEGLYGGRVGDKGFYRLFASGTYQDDTKSPSGNDQPDEWMAGELGFRVDAEPTPADQLMLTGHFRSARQDNQHLLWEATGRQRQIEEKLHFTHLNFTGRWQHDAPNDHQAVAQASLETFNFDQQKNLGIFFLQANLEMRYRFPLGQRQEWTVGGAYNLYRDDFDSSFTTFLDPGEKTWHTYSFFAQDDIKLTSTLGLTLGCRADHNTNTGWELQPDARLAWRPNERHTVWATLYSRAVRSPSRPEVSSNGRNIVTGVPASGPAPATLVAQQGNASVAAEELVAYEGGYRWKISPKLSLDTAAFLYDYDRLRTYEAGTPQIRGTYAIIPLVVDSQMHGKVYGAEVALDFRPAHWWRLQPMYSFLKTDLKLRSDSTDTALLDYFAGSSPTHQLSLRSSMDLPHDLRLDLWLRHVSPLLDGAIDAYWGLDARIAWQPGDQFELALVGQNLLDPSHPEFIQESIQLVPSQIERSFYLQASYHF